MQYINLGGFEDWRLPSKSELNKMYSNKDKIGNFANNGYWSSTDSDDEEYAWIPNFNGGLQEKEVRKDHFSVRAVRTFAL